MVLSKRLLGLAFASADFLVELAPDGIVTMALGSGPVPGLDADTFTGHPFADHLSKASAAVVDQALAGLKPGVRVGPLDILIACGDTVVRRAQISAFSMPDLAPNRSCSLSWQGPAFSLSWEGPPVLSAEDFLARTGDRVTAPDDNAEFAVAFVDVGGLSALGEAGSRVTARVEAALQSASVDGGLAARLTPDRYALLRARSDTRDIVGEVRELARDEGVVLDVARADVTLSGKAPLNALRALRFAIETCLRDEGLSAPDRTFDAALDRTVKDAAAFTAMVKDRSFSLHYQPIVDLKTGAVHHFEALSRFVGKPDPTPAIRMAEELAIIEGFDLAVAEKAIQRLRQPGSGLLKIAVNVSGASLGADGYVSALLKMTATAPGERRRLIVEVTETAAMADVEAAARRLSALRQAGIRVCIDDFGAGAASLDYLRGLAVDTVKIDGRFVRGLEHDARSRTMIAHLVELCGSLGVSTIAEFIETEPCADILRELGVDHGQGWLFGKAEAEPRTIVPALGASRRQGEVEAWG